MACAIVVEEFRSVLPEKMPCHVLDFRLHMSPDKLHQTLQESINTEAVNYDTVILGYGLCAQAVIGIQASCCRLIVPKVDDCIALFLGSRSDYKDRHRSHPGTYYLTNGWIRKGDTPFSEYEHAVQKYGKERADRIIKIMLANYNQLTLIDNGVHDMGESRDYARRTAERFGLKFEELKGSSRMLIKLVNGPWDDEVVVIEKGESIQFEHFL